MDSPEAASLHRCALRIRARVERTLIDMESAGAEIGAVLARPPERGAPCRRDLAVVQPVVFRLLEEHRDLVEGVGLVLDRNHLADTELCWEWWSHDGGSSPHFRRYEPGGGVEDYTDRDWFTGAREAGRPVVTGPFADSASSGERAITLAVPVHAGEFVDVLGANVPMANVQRLLGESLRPRCPEVLLLNEQDRVVVSTSARWVGGTLFHRETGVRWTGDIPLGERLRWRMVVGSAESRTFPPRLH